MSVKMELKEISEKELKEKLELHRKWLRGEEGGIKLDLRNTDLRHADLRQVDLRCAKLNNSDLRNSNLYEASLKGANLNNVDLRYADLESADLIYSHLEGTNLRYSDLSCADLSRLDLSKTKFYLTKLYKTKGNFVGVENIGSRNDTTHYFYNDNRIICGCFDGTMKEFEYKVKETYEENSKEYKQYMIAIDTLKKLAELEGEK